MTIKNAAQQLHLTYKDRPWYYMLGVGEATNTLYLYVHSLKKTPAVVRDLKQYEGYDLVVAKMGWARPP